MSMPPPQRGAPGSRARVLGLVLALGLGLALVVGLGLALSSAPRTGARAHAPESTPPVAVPAECADESSPEAVACVRAACERGDLAACYRAGTTASSAADATRRLEWLSSACRGELARACGELGARFAQGLPLRDDVSALVHHEEACMRGLGPSCAEVASLMEAGRGRAYDAGFVTAVLGRACALPPLEDGLVDGGDRAFAPQDRDASCERFATRLLDPTGGLASVTEQGSTALREACGRGVAATCRALVALATRGAAAGVDAAGARAIAEAACASGRTEGCAALADTAPH